MDNDNEPITRKLAKFLVISTISYKTTELAKSIADDYTQFEKDSLAVKLGSGAISLVVTSKLKPHTDKLVDKTADFIDAKRAERRTKKDNEKKD